LYQTDKSHNNMYSLMVGVLREGGRLALWIFVVEKRCCCWNFSCWVSHPYSRTAAVFWHAVAGVWV